MAIILDAMGSDSYPSPELEAAVLVRRTMGEELILVGKQELLEARFKELFPAEKPLHIVDAPDIVEMTDKPVESARKKPNNSWLSALTWSRTEKQKPLSQPGIPVLHSSMQ